MKVTATKEVPVCQYCNTSIRYNEMSGGRGYWSHDSAGSNGSTDCTRRNLVRANQIPEFKATPTTVYYKQEVNDNGE